MQVKKYNERSQMKLVILCDMCETSQTNDQVCTLFGKAGCTDFKLSSNARLKEAKFIYSSEEFGIFNDFILWCVCGHKNVPKDENGIMRYMGGLITCPNCKSQYQIHVKKVWLEKM